MREMLEFDTPEWQAVRNAKLQEWVQDPNAIRFIIDFADTCELFDDMIDRDKPLEDAHIVRVLFKVLTEIPMNPFFDCFKSQLVPIIITGINAWLDSTELENGSDNDKVFAYVLRDWYMSAPSPRSIWALTPAPLPAPLPPTLTLCGVAITLAPRRNATCCCSVSMRRRGCPW